MKRIHILTAGWTSPNGCAFLFPLVYWQQDLLDAGFDIQFFYNNEAALCNCDVLLMDSKYFASGWTKNSEETEGLIAELTSRIPNSVWFGISDSSGVDHMRPLPYVTRYAKNQLMRDREQYMQPIYGGGRIFAEYAYTNNFIEDSEPLWSKPVENSDDLSKLCVGWNSGLADYSRFGPFRAALYQKFRFQLLLNFTSSMTPISKSRSNDVVCRFGTKYGRESVAWQRKAVSEKLSRVPDKTKLRRKQYLDEMRDAKLTVSPFGLGEITLKDFEAMICGSALVKPNMDHIETWPNLYVTDETYFSHNWSLDDFEECIDRALSDPVKIVQVAEGAQQNYCKHTIGPNAATLFVEHFRSIVG